MKLFCLRHGVTRTVSEVNLDAIVREKAHGPGEGWASLGCHCRHRGSSLDCGRARLCSLETRKDNFHISPRPLAPLWCWCDESAWKENRIGTKHSKGVKSIVGGRWHLQSLRRGLCSTAVALISRSISEGSVHLLLENMRQGVQWDAAQRSWVVERAVAVWGTALNKNVYRSIITVCLMQLRQYITANIHPCLKIGDLKDVTLTWGAEPIKLWLWELFSSDLL